MFISIRKTYLQCDRDMFRKDIGLNKTYNNVEKIIAEKLSSQKLLKTNQ